MYDECNKMTNVNITGNLTVQGTNNIAIVFEVSQVISAAQMKALNATPIEMISAPGAGKAISVLLCTSSLDYGGTAYTSGGVTGLVYSGGTNFAWQTGAAADYQLSADKVWIYRQTTGVNTMEENVAVDFFSDTNDYATGNSPVTISASYVIVDV